MLAAPERQESAKRPRSRVLAKQESPLPPIVPTAKKRTLQPDASLSLRLSPLPSSAMKKRKVSGSLEAAADQPKARSRGPAADTESDGTTSEGLDVKEATRLRLLQKRSSRRLEKYLEEVLE